MGIQIEDGTGSGKTVKVDNENRLTVKSTTVTEIQHSNFDESLAFTLFGLSTPVYEDPSAGTGTLCVCYIKNTSELQMIITQMGIWSQSAQYVEPYINPVGTPTNTVSLTPVNMNLGSGLTASGYFYSGNPINGISGGTRITRFRIPANNATNFNSLDSKIVIPKNNIFVLYSSAENTSIEFTFNFYFHSAD